MLVSGSLWAFALLNSSAYTPPNVHRVGKNESFASISRRYGTGYQTLIDANPGIVPEKLQPGALITIPARIKASASPASNKPGTYCVQNGDTDWSIARRFNIKPSQLHDLNPSIKWSTLQIGAKLNVPQASTLASKPASNSLRTIAQTPKAPAYGKHTVTANDNDWIVARGYGITLHQLHVLNPTVNWNRLQIGTKLTVPARNPSTIPYIATKRAKVIRDNVIVRSGAKSDASRVTMVEVGRIALVADRIGDWYKLKFDGGTVGWVRGDMLAPVTAAMLASYEQPSKPHVIRQRSQSQTRLARRQAPSSRPGRNSSPSSDGVVAYSGDRDGVIGTALDKLGTRYRYGATGNGAFDCSGFTGYTYSRHGVRLPRTAAEQFTRGKSVSKGELKKGDLVFFRTTRSSRISHVGIYLGDGRFVHASSGGGKVKVSELTDGYYANRFAGARRVMEGSSGSAEKAKATEPKHEESPKSEQKSEGPGR